MVHVGEAGRAVGGGGEQSHRKSRLAQTDQHQAGKHRLGIGVFASLFVRSGK